MRVSPGIAARKNDDLENQDKQLLASNLPSWQASQEEVHAFNFML
jgi:hypothetical protein